MNAPAATTVVPLEDAQHVLPPKLAEVRAAGVTPDDDPGQADRIEAKLDAVLDGAAALREATEPLMAMATQPGGLMGFVGAMMRG